MIIHLASNILKFSIHIFGILTGWDMEYKDTIFQVFTLIVSLFTLALEGIVFALVITNTKFLPIFIIGGILNSLFEVFSNIKMLYIAIVKIKRLNNIMEITREEIEAEELDHTCVICQYDIEVGKILDCKHIFHLKCLKKWVLNENSCPSCKRGDVIFVDEDKICAFKVKLRTKKNLLRAGVKKEKFIEEIENIKGEEGNMKSKYNQLESKHLNLQKRREERREKYGTFDDFIDPDSDSEDTEQMISEVREVEERITYMMTEISKAKKTIEKYDQKLTKRLQKKHQRRLQERARRDLEKDKTDQNKLTPEEELSEAAFLVLDQAMKDLNEQKINKTPIHQEQQKETPEEMERKVSKVKRLWEYDLQPEKQNSEHPIIFEEDKLGINFDDIIDGEKDQEEKSREDEASPKSAPDLENKQSNPEFINEKPKFSILKDRATSQNDVEVRSIVIPGSTRNNQGKQLNFLHVFRQD